MEGVLDSLERVSGSSKSPGPNLEYVTLRVSKYHCVSFTNPKFINLFTFLPEETARASNALILIMPSQVTCSNRPVL